MKELNEESEERDRKESRKLLGRYIELLLKSGLDCDMDEPEVPSHTELFYEGDDDDSDYKLDINEEEFDRLLHTPIPLSESEEAEESDTETEKKDEQEDDEAD